MVLDNGLVRVVLAAGGPGPIREIAALGHAYLAKQKDLCFVVNEADTRQESERSLEVLEHSPVRARARISGAHYTQAGKRLLSYRLDVELWANWPALRLDYHFFNLEAGHDELDIHRIAMEWEVNLGKETRRHFLQTNHGLLFYPREVFNPGRVAICTDEFCGAPHVEDPAMLLDDVAYPAHLRPPLVNVSDWLGIGDGQRCVYLRMQDFMEMRPKRLCSEGDLVRMEYWPSTQPPLQLPQGRSRRQVMTVTFVNVSAMQESEIVRLLDGPLHEGRATADPDWLRQTGEFEMDRALTPASNLRFEKYLGRLVNLVTPQDMFDLGDTIDWGYCRTYIPIANNIPLKPNAPALPKVFRASMHNPLAEWAMPDLYEPVWTNNEYDGIFALCTELMRTGRGHLWRLARWAVRHNIEVDFIHYHEDRQQHRGSPQHSCRHNRSGCIPSHYWTQGLLQYYCLTGDPDVLEIAIGLGDKIIEDFTVPEFRESFWGFTRELGWPALALAHLADITGEPRFDRQISEILAYFMTYPRTPELDRAVAGGLVVWSCAFEGADLYLRRNEWPEFRAWLVEFLQSIRRELAEIQLHGGSATGMPPMVMAIGYELTGDSRFLNTGMMSVCDLMESPYWINPPNETKPMAITYRGLVRFLHHAQRVGLLDQLEYPYLEKLRSTLT